MKTAAIAITAALALSGAALAADDAATDPRASTLSARYSGSVYFLPVADIVISAVFPEGTYSAAARFTTAGVAAWFDDTDIEAEVSGYRQEAGFQPWRYEHFNHASSKNRTVGIDFPEGRATPDINPPFGSMGEPPASDEERYGAIDPLTTLMAIIAGVNPEAGEGPAGSILHGEENACSGRFPVFDGKARYDVRLEDGGRDRVRTRAWRGDAFVCHAYLEPISGYDPGDRPDETETARPVTLWLAPMDGLLVPVRFRAQTAIGQINIRAQRIQVQ